MNYQKLDAALSAALNNAQLSDEPSLLVSIRTSAPPDPVQQQELEQMGVRGVAEGGRIFSAQLSPRTVAELTYKPYVRLVSLSQRLHPLG